MKYTVHYTNNALKQLRKLDPQLGKKILKGIDAIADSPYEPHPNIKRLQGDIGGYRLRVGDYRVIYDLHNGVRVLEVIKIGHRKEVYR